MSKQGKRREKFEGRSGREGIFRGTWGRARACSHHEADEEERRAEVGGAVVGHGEGALEPPVDAAEVYQTSNIATGLHIVLGEGELSSHKALRIVCPQRSLSNHHLTLPSAGCPSTRISRPRDSVRPDANAREAGEGPGV